MVLVDLAPEHPAYYVCPLSEVARQCHARSQALLKKQGGTRPKTPASPHTVILLEMVKAGKDAWDMLRVAPAERIKIWQIGLKPGQIGPKQAARLRPINLYYVNLGRCKSLIPLQKKQRVFAAAKPA